MSVIDCKQMEMKGAQVNENLLAQVFEQQLHGVVVGQGQRANQVLHVGDPQAVVWDLCVTHRHIRHFSDCTNKTLGLNRVCEVQLSVNGSFVY